jgi:hypothetical protein
VRNRSPVISADFQADNRGKRYLKVVSIQGVSVVQNRLGRGIGQLPDVFFNFGTGLNDMEKDETAVGEYQITQP